MTETNTEPIYRHIVVGVDGSDHATAALHHASLLADEFDAKLTVVMAWSFPAIYSGSPAIDPERDAKAALSDVIDSGLTEAARDRTRAITRAGAPAGVLIDESEDADLLVLGSRGRGGFAGLLLGSVSTQCAAHAKCPVLIHH